MKRNPVPAEISPSALLSPLKGSKSICSTCVEPRVSEKVVEGQERLGKSCPGAGDCLGISLQLSTANQIRKKKETKRPASRG